MIKLFVYKRIPWAFKSEAGGWQDAYKIDWMATVKHWINKMKGE